MKSIYLTEDNIHFRALGNMTTNLWLMSKVKNFFAS